MAGEKSDPRARNRVGFRRNRSLRTQRRSHTGYSPRGTESRTSEGSWRLAPPNRAADGPLKATLLAGEGSGRKEYFENEMTVGFFRSLHLKQAPCNDGARKARNFIRCRRVGLARIMHHASRFCAPAWR